MYDVFLYLGIVFTLPNSEDLNEMQLQAAFHLGLHSLPKYMVRDFQNCSWGLWPSKTQIRLFGYIDQLFTEIFLVDI